MATPEPTTIIPDPAATPAGVETDEKKEMSEEEKNELGEFVRVRLSKFFDSYTAFLQILKSAHSLKIRTNATAQDELIKANYISSVYNTFNTLYKKENDPSFKELMDKLRTTGKENIYPHIRIPRILNISSLYGETGWSSAPFKEVSKSSPILPKSEEIDECLEEKYLIFQFNRNYYEMMSLFGVKLNGMSDQSFKAVMKAKNSALLTRNWTPPKDFIDKSSSLSKTEEKESIGETPITELFNEAKKTSEFANVIISLRDLFKQKIINQAMVDKLIDNRIEIVNSGSYSDKDKIIEILTLAKTNIASPTLRNDLAEIINRPKAGDLPVAAEPAPEGEEGEEKVAPEPVPAEEEKKEEEKVDYLGSVNRFKETIEYIDRTTSDFNRKASGVDKSNDEALEALRTEKEELINEIRARINVLGEDDVLVDNFRVFDGMDLLEILGFYSNGLENLLDRKDDFMILAPDIRSDTIEAMVKKAKEMMGSVVEEKAAPAEPAPVVEAFDIQPIMMPLPSRGETILVKKETEDELKALTDEEIDRLYADYFGDVKEDLSKDEKVFALINRNNELPRLNVPNFSSLKLSEWTLDSLRKYLKTLAELPEDEARMMTLYDKEGMYGFTPDNPFKYETSDAFGFNDEQFVKLGTTEKLPKRNEMMKQKDFDMTPEEWAEKNMASKLKSKQKVEEGFQAINRKLGKASKMATKAYLELDPDIANHEVYQSSGFADDFNESWDASWSADTWSRVGYIQDKAHWEIPTISKSASEDIVSVMANEMIGGSLNYEYVSRGEIPSWYDLA